MTPYERYCAQMKERGLKPTMTETQIHEAFGIKTEDTHAPIVFIKSVKSSKNLSKTCLKKDSLDDQKSSSNELLNVLTDRLKEKKETKKPKAVKPPKIKAVREKRVKKTAEELREAKRARQRNWYRNTVGKEVRTHLITRTSLIGMTPKEKMDHKSKLSILRNQRKKALGIPLPQRSDAQKEARKKYWASYYEQKKHDPDYILKRTTSKAKRLARMSLDT